MKYLVVHPDRYGRFGHQTTSIFSGIALAKITGYKLIYPKYMFFSDKWNKFIFWENISNLVCCSVDVPVSIRYLENKNTDNHGNRAWKIVSSKDLSEILAELHSYPSNTLINLPFDQPPGIMKNFLLDNYLRTNLKAIISPQLRLTGLPNKSICIHIRRGDCTPQRFPEWFISDNYYIALINGLLSQLPRDYILNICTQGDTEWLTQCSEMDDSRVKIFSTNDLFLNDADIRDFKIMLNSTILISCGSSFSRWAGILGNQKGLFDISRIDKMPGFRSYSPDDSPLTLIHAIATLNLDTY